MIAMQHYQIFLMDYSCLRVKHNKCVSNNVLVWECALIKCANVLLVITLKIAVDPKLNTRLRWNNLSQYFKKFWMKM